MRICYLANTAVPATTASAIQIIKMCESCHQRHQTAAGIITTQSKKVAVFDLRLKRIFGVTVIGFHSIVMRI